jgi:hypothetical protein
MTDKGDKAHTFAGWSYLDVYNFYQCLDNGKNHKSILEIGVADGSSLKLWRDKYFFKNVYGIDIDPHCILFRNRVIDIAIGSQDDPVFLQSCFPGKTFDVIVDDGSHINTFTLASFKYLWPRLNPGGLYIIEDLMCSYDKLQSEQNILSIWPGMKYNDPSKNYDNDRRLMDEFFQRKIYDLDHQRGEIRFLHFWSMMCVIGKV